MKDFDLGKGNMNRLLFTFSIPCIISMLINSIYNIVDQIFIGQGVGYLGNGATNVIFPVVIICNAIAQLIGNGSAANLSLKLGEGNKEEAKKSMGSAICLLFILAILVAVIGELFLPQLVGVFGCTEKIYPYAIDYGRIILLGAPFMIIYTGLASFIRADGSPKYSMICLVVGALINLVLDPIFIFVFSMGVKGGALATIIGQIVSCLIAVYYLRKTKSIDLHLKDIRLNRSIYKTLGYGASSFITQLTVLALFIVMNNVMTKYGSVSKFGADIPLSVYGVVSKLNQVYISVLLGLAIGAQPIIGFNYGAGNIHRVKEAIRKVLMIGIGIGLVFNLGFVLFPKQLVSIFGSASDPLYLEFAVDCCRIFLMLCAINAFEICSGILIQSLGNVRKSICVSLTRQIILFIPICLILSSKIGLYGALYAGPIADGIACVVIIFIFFSEYRKLQKYAPIIDEVDTEVFDNGTSKLSTPMIITMNREYGTGGRYVAKELSKQLHIPCYDKEFIHLTKAKSGLSDEFILEHEEQKESFLTSCYDMNDRLYEMESQVILDLAKTGSCILVGRCADYVLKDEPNLFRIFLYNKEEEKVKRAVTYYHMGDKDVKKKIRKINKERANYYHYYTNQDWTDMKNYDCSMNVDCLGIEKSVSVLATMILEKDKIEAEKKSF